MARQSNEELTVHGIKVDSINEKYVAQALDKLNLDYAYQYYFGGVGIRGTQIIDFLVYTVPKPTPLFVHGEYWHTGRYAAEENLKMASLQSQMRGSWFDAIIIWEHECETVEQAMKTLGQKLGL